MIILYLLIAVLSFLSGYLIAKREIPKPNEIRKKGELALDERLRREYENFLNYDGSEQN